MFELNQTFSNLLIFLKCVQTCLTWFKLFQPCLNLLKHVQTCSNLPKPAQYCSNLLKLVKICLKLFNIVQTCSNLFILVQTCSNSRTKNNKKQKYWFEHMCNFNLLCQFSWQNPKSPLCDNQIFTLQVSGQQQKLLWIHNKPVNSWWFIHHMKTYSLTSRPCTSCIIRVACPKGSYVMVYTLPQNQFITYNNKMYCYLVSQTALVNYIN